MRQLISWQLSILLLAGMAAGAQVPNSNQNGQSPDSPPAENATPPAASQAPTRQPMITPGVTVTGTPPRAEPLLPKLPPDQFTDCYAINNTKDPETMDFLGMKLCELQLARDERIVIEKCTNHDGKTEPPVIVQACNELLNRDMLHGHERFYLFVDRAMGYVAQGDKQHALDDYNTAVKFAPKYAQPYYYRGVFYAGQTDVEAALRDFDTALSLNPQFIPALLERAKIHKTQNDLSGALADYSEAIRLKPKKAAAWTERGYVCLLQHDYESAIKDEAEAIRLDPKLARAWYLRGAAYGNLGDSPNAVSDVATAVRLDPSLDRYISTKGKTATLTLPPL
jgi:tetratricopeptide (TPR) repeat protein